MFTKLGFLLFITVLYKVNAEPYETEMPKGKCFSFKIKTTSFFRVSIGVLNDDKSHNTSFYTYLGYKYAQKPNEQFSGLYNPALKKYEISDVATNNLINPNEYTEFWLTFYDNVFKIGVKSEPKPFMVYTYSNDLDRIQITPGESGKIEDLVIPEHFECPIMMTARVTPIVVKETIVNLGKKGNYIMPIPSNKCLTFKIKQEPFFRVYFGTINENYDLNATFYTYMGYKYGGKAEQYSGLYDVATKKYPIHDKVTPSLLSDKTYQEFVLNFDDNEFKIGLLNDKEPLMTHKFDGNAEDHHIMIAADDQPSVLVFKNPDVCPSPSLNP